jgi:hypothetical protein
MAELFALATEGDLEDMLIFNTLREYAAVYISVEAKFPHLYWTQSAASFYFDICSISPLL